MGLVVGFDCISRESQKLYVVKFASVIQPVDRGRENKSFKVLNSNFQMGLMLYYDSVMLAKVLSAYYYLACII